MSNSQYGIPEDIFHVPLTREQRRQLEASFPKCQCGATLGLRRQQEGIKVCGRCETVLAERNELIDLERRTCEAESLDELRAVVLDIIHRLRRS